MAAGSQADGLKRHFCESHWARGNAALLQEMVLNPPAEFLHPVSLNEIRNLSRGGPGEERQLRCSRRRRTAARRSWHPCVLVACDSHTAPVARGRTNGLLCSEKARSLPSALCPLPSKERLLWALPLCLSGFICARAGFVVRLLACRPSVCPLSQKALGGHTQSEHWRMADGGQEGQGARGCTPHSLSSSGHRPHL